MNPELARLAHGWSGAALGYLCILLPMLAGLAQGRAPPLRFFLSPVLAVPVTGVAAVAIALLRPLVHAIGMSVTDTDQVALAAPLAVAIGYASGRLLARSSTTRTGYRRGAIIATAMAPVEGYSSGRARRTQRAPRETEESLHLAGVPIGEPDETKHFKVIGTTGTGKSTGIQELLSGALARGDGAVIADPDGAYLARFYRPGRGDVVLNPFDARSVKWDLFDEVESDHDVEQLARSLIPDHGESDRSWNEYARTFFTSVAQQMHTAGAKDTAELYRVITRAPLEELKILLSGTAAEPFLDIGNERMFGSVRAVASSAVRALKYVIAQRAAPLSIRRWVREGAERRKDGRGSVLYLPYKAGEIAALRSMISAWLRIAVFEAMNVAEGDQRLWFAVDELDALGEIDGLKDALARLRKFGGRAVLGFQSIGQVSGLYGRAAAGTLVENCANTLILRCSASEHGGTSEFASRLIGEREISRTTSSVSRSAGRWRGAITLSEHVAIEPAVLPSEIERLPDLEGWLKLSSNPDWLRVRLSPTMLRTRHVRRCTPRT